MIQNTSGMFPPEYIGNGSRILLQLFQIPSGVVPEQFVVVVHSGKKIKMLVNRAQKWQLQLPPEDLVGTITRNALEISLLVLSGIPHIIDPRTPLRLALRLFTELFQKRFYGLHNKFSSGIF